MTRNLWNSGLTKPVRVMRNPLRQDDKPWLVFCGLCNNHGEDSIFGALLAPPLGWAGSWRAAQDFAQSHAVEHEKTRCTTCLHLPAQPISKTVTAGQPK